MLGSLKKFFGNDENQAPESEFYDPMPVSNNPNFLTDPSKIYRLLKDIEEASPLCKINFEGVKEEFNSSILDVQSENQKIILDELIPFHGNELILKHNRLKLSTNFKGIGLSFKLFDIVEGSSRGIAFYKARIPQRIYYPQRRSSLRVQIHSLNIAFSGVINRTHSSIGGYIFDLSRGGVGIVCMSDRLRLQRGDIISQCKLILNDKTVNFDLAVRFVKTIGPGSNKVQIGGCFEKLSSKSQLKIEHIVVSLEREEIRRRKG